MFPEDVPGGKNSCAKGLYGGKGEVDGFPSTPGGTTVAHRQGKRYRDACARQTAVGKSHSKGVIDDGNGTLMDLKQIFITKLVQKTKGGAYELLKLFQESWSIYSTYVHIW